MRNHSAPAAKSPPPACATVRDSLPSQASHAASDPSESQHPHSGSTRTQELGPDLINVPLDQLQEPVSGLSMALCKDLAAAVACGYGVEILSKEINGQKHTVVLLGERHSGNNDSELEAASNVIRHFSSIALEGVDSSKYPGAPSYYNDLAERRERASAQKGLHNKGAIDLAVGRMEATARLANQILDDITEHLVQKKSDSIVISSMTHKQYGVDKDLFTDAVSLMLSWIRTELAHENRDPHPQQCLSMHHLEDGHRPSLLEHFNYVNQAFGIHFIKFFRSDFAANTVLVSTLGFAAASCLRLLLPWQSLTSAQTLSGLIALPYWGLIATKVLFYASGAYKAAAAIEDRLEGFRHARREETMARAINNILGAGTPQLPLLAQMGRAHVAPIAKRLVEQFGWTVTTKSTIPFLPGTESSPPSQTESPLDPHI
ncbi:MAG: hypothetical protein ACK5Y6_01400 [Pseudomonadota bacterium]